MPGLFRETAIVKVMPRYAIVNCMDEPVELCQQNQFGRTLCVPPYLAVPWHRANVTHSANVRLKFGDYPWTLGSVDIDEIGSTDIMLASDNAQPAVMHVEVKLADAHEDCYISVIIWRCNVDNAGMRIQNDTDMPILVQQDLTLPTASKLPVTTQHSTSQNVFSTPMKKALSTPYEICVLPGGISTNTNSVLAQY